MIASIVTVGQTKVLPETVIVFTFERYKLCVLLNVESETVPVAELP